MAISHDAGIPHILYRQIHEKTKALEVGLNLGPSKHRLQSSCFIHYAMTPSVFNTEDYGAITQVK